jgi:hypothetical protein
MSKRLQVILDDQEMREVRHAARLKRMTVAEWVRQAIRTARRREPAVDPRKKLEAVRLAASHSFPTADIGRMLDEIERGYAEGQPR